MTFGVEAERAARQPAAPSEQQEAHIAAVRRRLENSAARPAVHPLKGSAQEARAKRLPLAELSAGQRAVLDGEGGNPECVQQRVRQPTQAVKVRRRKARRGARRGTVRQGSSMSTALPGLTSLCRGSTLPISQETGGERCVRARRPFSHERPSTSTDGPTSRRTRDDDSPC